MGSELSQKLTKLKACPGLALFRWTSTTKRVGNMFIPLPELRLNILTSLNDEVHLSVSAPVLQYSHGRPEIVLYDEDLLLITEGTRKGINIPTGFVKDGEKYVKLKGLTHRVITDDCPKPVADKIVTMGSTRTTPTISLPMPDTFRITRNPENIRPVYTAEIVKLIGGTKEDSPEELHRKFVENVALFSDDTGDGYVFPNNIIAAGGMPCVTTTGISRSSGSLVFQMPLQQLESELSRRRWKIHLHE